MEKEQPEVCSCFIGSNCIKNFVTNFMKNFGPEATKNVMLNSAEHEISNAHKYKKCQEIEVLQAQISLEFYFSCS